MKIPACTISGTTAIASRKREATGASTRTVLHVNVSSHTTSSGSARSWRWNPCHAVAATSVTQKTTPRIGRLDTIVAEMNAGRGAGLRRTSVELLTNACGATDSVIEMKFHTQMPTSANNTYGMDPVCTSVTPENAIVTAASMPSGWIRSQSGPSADCLYLTLTSRPPTIQATRADGRMSRTVTRFEVGVASRIGSELRDDSRSGRAAAVAAAGAVISLTRAATVRLVLAGEQA